MTTGTTLYHPSIKRPEGGANDTGRVAAGKAVPAQVYRPIHRAERGANSTGPSKPV